MRCSWSALTSSAAVRAIASSSRSLSVARRVRAAEVAVRDRNGPLLRPTVPVEPRPRSPAVRERDGGAATLEIVPLPAVEHRENFRIVEPVHLALDHPASVDESRVRAEIDEPP